MTDQVLQVLRDPERVSALLRSNLMGEPHGDAFDRLARLAARLLNAPVGLVNFIDTRRQIFKGSCGLGSREMPMDWGFCPFTLASGVPLLIDDVRADPRHKGNPVISEVGVVAYAGVPLLDEADRALGTLCVLDFQPREWSDEDAHTLQEMAATVVSEIRLRIQSDEQRHLLEAFEETPCLVAITRDRNHMITFANGAHATVYGPCPYGVPIRQVLPQPAHHRYLTLLDEVYASGEAGQIREEAVALHGAGDRALGYFTFVCNPLRAPSGDVDGVLTVAVDVTEQVRMRQELRESQLRLHDTALTLQRNLLPQRPHRPDSLEVAVRYVTGGGHSRPPAVRAGSGELAPSPTSWNTEVGGDWYDVIPLGVGRVALVIGDVMGRGVHAAAVMGQMRTAVRAFALLDLPPNEILELLDELVGEIAPDQIVTCVYAVYDPVDQELAYAAAGHPPLLLVDRDGTTRRLEHAGDAPLGAQAGPFLVNRTPLAAGTTAVLYTDGLVEENGQDIDVGIDALADVLSESYCKDLEEACDIIFERLRPHERRPDDVALMLLRVSQSGYLGRHVLRFPAERMAAHQAREFVTRTLRGWAVEEPYSSNIVLAVNELVSNSLIHANGPVELHLRRTSGQIHVEVRDCDHRLPHRRQAADSDENGRGLQLVAHLGERWGARHVEAGKSVWCEFPLPCPPHSAIDHESTY